MTMSVNGSFNVMMKFPREVESGLRKAASYVVQDYQGTHRVVGSGERKIALV
jgi:hypothetical protein